jgi:DNA polymerase (family 10)
VDELRAKLIEPELREGYDEIDHAERGTLSAMVTMRDIRGELHAYSTSSDGSNSIEQMAIAARDFGYEYIGITDHSQSLKIARGVSVEDMWKQIRFIDKPELPLGRHTGLEVGRGRHSGRWRARLSRLASAGT